MITARLRCVAQANRPSAAPLRFLALAVLLLGLMLTHGMNAENPAGHTDGAPHFGASVPASAHFDTGASGNSHPDSSSDHGHDGHQDKHLDCLSGQPESGPVLDAPLSSPQHEAHASAEIRQCRTAPVSDPPREGLSAQQRRSTVLRV
ncbi:hypothetical protein ACQEU8_02985 [Streptomyces sp. CA-250714]|uniref:hypothetical protein n=1 Tax=Streptomyces sp. CA-250714 TaxID=3240060 RepID=UPI003D94BF53